MERLSGLDASFLYLETPSLHMHVAMTMVFDPSTVPGGYSFDRMKESIAERTPLRPGLPAPPGRGARSGSATRCGSTIPDFDIDYHVRLAAVPEPGRAARAGRPGRRHRRPPARPVPAAVGDVDRRGPGRRPHRLHRQDAPLDGGRGVRRRAALGALRPRARAGAGAPPRTGAGAVDDTDPLGPRADGPGRGGPDPATLRDHPGHRPDRPPGAQRPPGPARI